MNTGDKALADSSTCSHSHSILLSSNRDSSTAAASLTASCSTTIMLLLLRRQPNTISKLSRCTSMSST